MAFALTALYLQWLAFGVALSFCFKDSSQICFKPAVDMRGLWFRPNKMYFTATATCTIMEGAAIAPDFKKKNPEILFADSGSGRLRR